MTGIQKKYPREGSFRCPPLAGFGVAEAGSCADYTMGVRGAAVRPLGLGSSRSSAGHTGT